MINNITFKTLIFTELNSDNYKNLIEGKPKMIEIVNYGVHSTTDTNKLVYIEFKNFLPSMNNLICHVSNGNNFLINTSLKFNNINSFNGSFNYKVNDIETGLEIDDYIFVLNLNLYY